MGGGLSIGNVGTERIVEQWASKLPLVEKLSELLLGQLQLPADLEAVASLSSDQVKEISRQFSASLEEVLLSSISKLKAALEIQQTQESNPKFGMYPGGSGTINDFHQTTLYEEIGAPNPNWLQGMQSEHTRNSDTFTTRNYNITTCPADEWAYVLGEKTPTDGHMAHGRNIKSIDSLMRMELTQTAGLSRTEVMSIVLYTGPMYQLYNTVLRKYPLDKYTELKSKDNLFPTTICVLVSAIQKLARKMKLVPGNVLYRGIDGNMQLPPEFSQPDENGCFGLMETAFMSTTFDYLTAVSRYSNIGRSRAPKVFRITPCSVDRGADISLYSQYADEQEFLYVPRSFLQPVGIPELRVETEGVVQIQDIKVNANQKAVTIEEYAKRKQELHVASFKLLLQDLEVQLNNKVSDT